MTLPQQCNESRWSDRDGRDLPELAQRSNVLTRQIEGVARNVPERMWFTISVAVPDRDNVNDYPMRIAVQAEGADSDAAYGLPLKIGRDPTG